MKLMHLNILLVEDSVEDADLIQTAFSDSVLNPTISVMTDGQKALDYLDKKGAYKDTVMPDLILLDLNLPKKNGHEILSKIKSDLQLRMIPVVVLTTSRSSTDIIKSYQNYTNCYICKPLVYEQYIEVVKEIENFWLGVVELPRSRPGGYYEL